MNEPVFTVPVGTADESLSREWLVTNGLGGYASGSILGINTRRHHGLFIPNLPAPRGRTMMISFLKEDLEIDGKQICLGGVEYNDKKIEMTGAQYLKEFRLDWLTPVWTFDIHGNIIEKRILMPHGQNTVYVSYRLVKGKEAQLHLRPYCGCRKHDSNLGYPRMWPFIVTHEGDRYEVSIFDGSPILKVMLKPFEGTYQAQNHLLKNVFYRVEDMRGLDCVENIFSPGFFTVPLKEGNTVYFLASTENWESLNEDPAKIFEDELARRKKLISLNGASDHFMTAQLTLAADQFIVLPRTRNSKEALADGSSAQVRTIIAGYHWFTDWGRDTMISLEGLTLCTGRHEEAKAILLTFGRYVHNGLLPNHFPEGERHAIYNTVDATFWYFHAIDRYYQFTKDKSVIESLYEVLQSMIESHIRGTDFGIHMDPADGLIQAAAEGFQLTWMDAKVDEWVVTPRRGKPVEIQALWFNALQLMAGWSRLLNKPDQAYTELAQKVHTSFNARFWCAEKNYLYDVIDTQKGDDSLLRPNQIFSISLHYPILSQHLWKQVVDCVGKELLTPLGLRTLNTADKHYHGRYEGNRWERDAAYHQGLVWAWLIGPFMDAYKKVYGQDADVQEFLRPFQAHLTESGIGTISEIFDGDAPYTPRGCIAQAWSVAEVLRYYYSR